MTPKHFARGLLLLASLAAIGFLAESGVLGEALETGWIDTYVRDQALTGQLLFVGVGVLFTGIGLPRQVLAFLGGYAFGFVTGTVLALAATVLGCALAFSYSRFIGRDFVLSRFPGRIRRVDAFLHDSPFAMTLLLRLLPLGSNFAINLAAGVSGIAALPFLLGSALGYVPQMMVFSLLGSGINVDPVLRTGLSVVLFVVSAAIGVALYRRYRRGRSFDAELDGAAPESPAAGGGGRRG